MGLFGNFCIYFNWDIYIKGEDKMKKLIVVSLLLVAYLHANTIQKADALCKQKEYKKAVKIYTKLCKEKNAEACKKLKVMPKTYYYDVSKIDANKKLESFYLIYKAEGNKYKLKAAAAETREKEYKRELNCNYKNGTYLCNADCDSGTIEVDLNKTIVKLNLDMYLGFNPKGLRVMLKNGKSIKPNKEKK
jgi:hypothetical protein